jgi:hypothetical protein
MLTSRINNQNGHTATINSLYSGRVSTLAVTNTQRENRDELDVQRFSTQVDQQFFRDRLINRLRKQAQNDPRLLAAVETLENGAYNRREFARLRPFVRAVIGELARETKFKRLVPADR